MLDVWQIQMIQTSKEKNAMPNHAKSMYFPNGWEVLPASWFSRTNSSSNDGPALVIWLRSDMVPFLASSCQFSPMAFLGFDSNTTSNRKSNKKSMALPAASAAMLLTSKDCLWSCRRHESTQHIFLDITSAGFTVYSDNPTQSTPPPFENVDPRREKGLKQVQKKMKTLNSYSGSSNMFLGAGVVPRLLEVNLWKQPVFVDPLMSRVPSQRKGFWIGHFTNSFYFAGGGKLIYWRRGFLPGNVTSLKRSGSTRCKFLSLKVPLEHQNLGKYLIFYYSWT